MSLNLRTAKDGQYSTLLSIWSERAKKVQERKETTKDIDRQNENLISELKRLFAPISFKIKSGIEISIHDSCTCIKIPYHWVSKKSHEIVFYVSLNENPICWILKNEDSVNAFVVRVNRNLRFLKAKIHKMGATCLCSEGVIIKQETKDRYFL